MRYPGYKGGHGPEGCIREALLHNKDLCVDATHPYAVEAGKNIREAAERTGVHCIRLLREYTGDLPEYEGCTYVEDAAMAAKAASGISGNILLTTGVKELPFFEGIERERLFVRILPVADSLEKCNEAGIPAGLIRMSCGLEDSEDLIADLKQALEAI